MYNVNHMNKIRRVDQSKPKYNDGVPSLIKEEDKRIDLVHIKENMQRFEDAQNKKTKKKLNSTGK